MANKPKWSPTNTYVLFIILSCSVVIAGVWLEYWKVAVTAAAVSVVFVALQLGSIFNQYAGIIQLVQILNSLLVAALKGMGYELEGTPPVEEPQPPSI